MPSSAPRYLSRVSGARWFVAVALALPYAIAVAALRGLTVTLPIFHGSDERVYHLPTIHRFAGQLPFPDLVHYHAAQTPLFHLLMACLGKLIGYQAWRLRLVEVVISYLLAWAVFGLLHRRLGVGRLPALALTLLFILSPYVFGPSFRVVTDNLALLFVVLAVERLERFRQDGSLGAYAVACLCVGLSILTRQSSAFMLAVAGVYALLSGLPRRRLIPALCTLAAAAVPAGVLFLLWHGLVPKGGSGASCGLCSSATGPGAARGLVSVQSVELALAALAVYGAVLFAPHAGAAARNRVIPPDRLAARTRPGAGWAGIAALAGLLLLIGWPARPGSTAHSAGWLWNLARRLPGIDSSSLAFWALVPLAGAMIALRARLTPWRLLPAAFWGCFLIQALATRLPWQKYVDPFALLAVLFTVRRQEVARAWQLLGVAALVLGSAAYAAALGVGGGS
jgi:hypothetical protein